MIKSQALSRGAVSKPCFLLSFAINLSYLTKFALVVGTTSLLALNTAKAADAMAEKKSIKIGFDQDALITAPDSQSPFFDQSSSTQGMTEAISTDKHLAPVTDDKVENGITEKKVKISNDT